MRKEGQVEIPSTSRRAGREAASLPLLCLFKTVGIEQMLRVCLQMLNTRPEFPV